MYSKQSESKHNSETYEASIFFLLILLQYTNIHTQNVLKKPLMSHKHSFFLLVFQFCLLFPSLCAVLPQPSKYFL